MPDNTLHPLEFTVPGAAAFRMMPVNGGAFDMGGADDQAYDDEKPVHRVVLSSFYLAEFPVTQDLWSALMPEWPRPSYFRGPRRPVEQVSWYHAVVFCNRLSKYFGLDCAYYSDTRHTVPYGFVNGQWQLPEAGPVHIHPEARGFRLPSEARWEYAARGGAGAEPFLFAGSDHLDEVGWYNANSHAETKPVGLKASNKLGLFDMNGNVWEWCEDQWHDSYSAPGRPDDGTAWVDGEDGADRVRRGGHWGNAPRGCRVACRFYDRPANRWNGLGFRLALLPQ